MSTAIDRLTVYSAFAGTNFQRSYPMNFQSGFMGDTPRRSVSFYETHLDDGTMGRESVIVAARPRDDTAFPDLAVSLDGGERFSGLSNPESNPKIPLDDDEVARAEVVDAAVTGIPARALLISRPQVNLARKLGLLWGAVTVIDGQAPEANQRVAYAALRPVWGSGTDRAAIPDAVREGYSLFYPSPDIPASWMKHHRYVTINHDITPFETATFMRDSAALLAVGTERDNLGIGCLFWEAALIYLAQGEKGHAHHCLEMAKNHLELGRHDPDGPQVVIALGEIASLQKKMKGKRRE